LDVLKQAGATPVPLLATMAMASGTVERKSFDTIMGEIEQRLKAAGPVDGVFLALHGAMIVEDQPDAESEIVRRVRAQLKPGTPIAVSLDLHGHITAGHDPARCGLYRLSRISPYRHV
jgi:microcystin degradation protein MlrC